MSLVKEDVIRIATQHISHKEFGRAVVESMARGNTHITNDGQMEIDVDWIAEYFDTDKDVILILGEHYDYWTLS